MRREDLLVEIARLDKEINRVLAATELPKIDTRPFPLGTWIFAGMCLAWTEFGYMIAGAELYHMQTATYTWYLAIVAAVAALLSTISWLVRGGGYRTKNDDYFNASRKARELQERRRDLQAELRAISGE